MRDVSDDRFIDRKAEQELFTNMLRFEDEAHLLVISDRGGRGKSLLLERLAYLCRWTHQIPVSLVSLDQMEGNDTRRIALVERIRKDLKSSQLAFPGFDRLNNARIFRQHEAFGGGFASAYGQGDFRNAVVHPGGRAGGIVADTVVMKEREWTPEIEEFATEQCLQAFLEDLRAVASDRTVVLVLDAVDEKSDRVLREWVINELTRAYCLNRERCPKRLIIVLAGRQSFPFLGIAELAPLIKSIRSLSEWQPEHVRAFLAVNGVKNVDETVVALVTKHLATEDSSLLDALGFAKLITQLGFRGMLERMGVSDGG